MKPIYFSFFIAFVLMSCSTEPKQNASTAPASQVYANIIMENSVLQTNCNATIEKHTLMLTGKKILNATVTLKVTNAYGDEVSCVSYPAKQLIHQEYSTADATLKEAHIREVVQNYFEQEDEIAFLN